jgi:hypothetical protein
LDEVCYCALQNIKVAQRQWKIYYDSRLKPILFKPKDLVLLYDSRFSKKIGHVENAVARPL